MAADETDPLYDPMRRQQGKSARVPPVIEGEAVETKPAAPAPAAPEPEPERAPAVEAQAPAEPPPAEEPAPETAPEPTPSPLPDAASGPLPLAGLLLGAIGSALGLYGAFEAQNAASETAGLRAEIAGLRTGGAATSPAADQFATLERRLAALEQRPTAAPAAPAPDPAAMRALAERVAAVEAAVKAAGDSAAAALQTAKGAAEASARPLPPPADLQPLERRLATLEAREAPAAAMAAAVRRAEAAGLAVVAGSITRALDRGSPFEAELAAAANLGADPAKLAPLQALAKTGAPTAASLARLWAGESRAALDAAQPPGAGEQGWIDRLKAGAARVIQVRPVGEPAGEDPAALGARIESALARGDAAQALAAWTKLPEPARAASRAFGEAARQLAAAQQAALALGSGAVADLARSKGAP